MAEELRHRGAYLPASGHGAPACRAPDGRGSVLLWEVEGQRPDPPGPRWGGGLHMGSPGRQGGGSQGQTRQAGPSPVAPGRDSGGGASSAMTGGRARSAPLSPAKLHPLSASVSPSSKRAGERAPASGGCHLQLRVRALADCRPPGDDDRVSAQSRPGECRRGGRCTGTLSVVLPCAEFPSLPSRVTDMCLPGSVGS